MKYVNEFVNTYIPLFMHSFVTLVLSYISIEIKKIYKNHIIDKTKKDVIKEVCQAINQLYPNLNGQDKLNKATNNIKEILKEKNIVISDLELNMYIESRVYIINNTLKTKKETI